MEDRQERRRRARARCYRSPAASHRRRRFSIAARRDLEAARAAERWRALAPYLDQALTLTPGERAGWLARLHAEDPAVASEVEALLERHGDLEEERFLDRPPGEPAAASLAGQQLGAYTLRSLLGQGGMGSAWLAERSDGRFEGRAAVKLLNASLIGPEGEARFRREGSILARLRHPHIAQLTDAGVSPAGQPCIVLEYVDVNGYWAPEVVP